jgi:hypothetical protein
MTYPKTKLEITKSVLSQIPNSEWGSLPVDTVLSRWWLTGRLGDKLRLSDNGQAAFKEAKIEYYNVVFDIKETCSSLSVTSFDGLMFTISKYIRCPYWLSPDHTPKHQIHLRLYDHRIATLVALHGGIADYILSIKDSESRNKS